MKAMLYMQVFENDEKGAELIAQLKKDFPETKPGKNADKILENMEKQKEAKKIQKSLAEGTKFPDFDEKDLDWQTAVDRQLQRQGGAGRLLGDLVRTVRCRTAQRAQGLRGPSRQRL